MERWRAERESPPAYRSDLDGNIRVALDYGEPARASVIFEFMLETLRDETLRSTTRRSAARFASLAEVVLGAPAATRLDAAFRRLASNRVGRSLLVSAMSSASDRFRNAAIAWIRPALRASPARHPTEHVSEGQEWVWVLQAAGDPGATALKELLESDGIKDPVAVSLARGHLSRRGG